MKKIIHFIKYNNATTITIAVLLLASTAMAASPDARELLYNTENIPHSVDNSYLLNTQIGRSDFGLAILEVEEDNEGYYIKYQYNTVKVEEYSWQPISKEGTLTVLKSSLGNQDLGELVARELGQLIDREYTYVKDSQKIEQSKGPSQKVITTKYAGLIGALLDPEDKVFPGYEPVVKQTNQYELENKSTRITNTATITITAEDGGQNEAVPGYVIEPDRTSDAIQGFIIPEDNTSDALPGFIIPVEPISDASQGFSTSTEVIVDNNTTTDAGTMR